MLDNMSTDNFFFQIITFMRYLIFNLHLVLYNFHSQGYAFHTYSTGTVSCYTPHQNTIQGKALLYAYVRPPLIIKVIVAQPPSDQLCYASLFFNY